MVCCNIYVQAARHVAGIEIGGGVGKFLIFKIFNFLRTQKYIGKIIIVGYMRELKKPNIV